MKKLVFLILILGLAQSLLAQETIYFPAFEAINVNHKHQYVASRLFKNYVDANGKYTIVLPEKLNNEALYIESPSEVKANALAKQTSYYIIADMSAIGDLLIVNMKMYNTASGQMVWSDALKADELEDLDPVIRLFANALGSDESAVKSGDIYSVTQYDSKELNKRQATQSWGITIGGGSVLANHMKESTISGFGVLRTYDIRELILDVKFEFYTGGHARTTRIGMNILKPANNKNTTLFYGGGMFYGGTVYDTDKYKSSDVVSSYEPKYREVRNSGLELEGNFGVIFNRLSSIQLRATVSPSFAFYRIKGTVGAIRIGLTATF